jgi:hypothetical protein
VLARLITLNRPAWRRNRGQTRSIAQALPLSHVEDPDLTLIVGARKLMRDDDKTRLVGIVRASLAKRQSGMPLMDFAVQVSEGQSTFAKPIP